ncbi:Retrovirus-related Pol polyprotein from transposon TNT 1-94 [Symbiodinium microadriaticum]|uniref:Retrovirus-related Pol polyprotein from transposon TNT 1-94 n=1 Tax=Symbiodinium microadriaticum TaxID=2951 RepID=A0A1Q9E5V9_SYMMI|nr:Retrovirus-related Pol polyprotein from transposon TNT 1-94 [Symbiodinium microadriaticum]
MDAVLRGVQQLQELQAAALSRNQTPAAEVIKPGTTTLPQLPEMVPGAETAMKFQDWLELVTAVMCDVSEQSATWWKRVLEEVERTYRSWLMSTPLERLAVQPKGDELATERWVRLNARVSAMILAAMSAEQQADMDQDKNKQKEKDKGATATAEVGKTPKPGSTGSPQSSKDQRTPRPEAPTVATMTTTTPTSTIDTASSMSGSTVQGTPWTLENLIAAAQQVVQNQGTPVSGDSSPEKTKAEMKTMVVHDVRVCSVGNSSAALLDTGATHCLRNAHDDGEWSNSESVMVQLAGNSKLMMKLSDSGSLLMPPRSTSSTTSSATTTAQTIVPMGELVRTLGYTLIWGPDECYLEDCNGVRTALNVATGCPQMCEAAALALIAKLEDKKRERLENETLTTMDAVSLAALNMERGWWDFLREYVDTGATERGLRALRDTPFFQGLPGECLSGLVQDNMKDPGWAIMKQVDFLTRPQKRRMWTAKRWIVHLYAGNPGHYQVFQLDEGDTMVIELDVDRNKAHDVQRDATWRLLLWGAMNGKIDAVIGAPPGRQGIPGQSKAPSKQDIRNTPLVARMLWLYAIAEAARSTSSTTSINRQRCYYFVVDFKVVEELRGGNGYDKVTFDQQAMGAETRLMTTLGTNVYYLMGLEGLGRDECHQESTQGRATTAVWSDGLVQALVMALRLWKRDPREAPSLAAMSASQWKAHVDSGHAEYRRDCLTCVMSRGTGKRHGRVRHPDSFTLTTDVAGPISAGLDATSKGTMGKGLRYFLVGKYTLPREYVKAYTGKEPPADDGLGREVPTGDISSGTRAEPNEPSLLPPREDGDGKQEEYAEVFPKDNELEGDEALQLRPKGDGLDRQEEFVQSPAGDYIHEPDEPSLLPPREDGDPFILCEDEPGEQGRIFSDEDEPGEQGHGRSYILQPEDGKREFVGSTEAQREEYKDYEDSIYEPSEVEDEVSAPTKNAGTGSSRIIQDCEAPEATVLIFARALKDNTAQSIKAAIQDIVLYLESHGLHVYRHHADHGETFNHTIRSWFRDKGIRATWAEAGIPQGNGRAESAVRWIKDRARTLLMSARLPSRLWPTAIEAAAAAQRAQVLQWRSKMAAPYGAIVHIKQKAFDSQGPRRREKAFESRWKRGVYVGLSNLMEGGHVIYEPGSEGSKEKFFHTFYVRANLQDPGRTDKELVIGEPPKPRRRLPMKTPEAEVEMRILSLSKEELKSYAAERAKEILESWCYSEAMEFVNGLAEARFFEDKKFGIWRHGGAVGWTVAFQEFPDVAKLLATLILEVNPEATFTAITVTYNMDRGQHRDSNNDENANNYLLPLQLPKTGGELWVELSPGDQLRGPVLDRHDEKGGKRYGQVLSFTKDAITEFSPRKLHEVLPWEGTRSMIIAYTPQAMGKITQDMVGTMEAHGYAVPISQLPEYFLRGEQPSPSAQSMAVSSEEENQGDYIEDGPHGEEEWDMYLEVEGGMVRLQPEGRALLQPHVAKLEVSYTPDIEKVIGELTSPLEVTHTVNPRDAMEHLPLWREAIVKELAAVEVAIKRLQVGTQERREWLQHPRAQKLPTKLVFTIKPNPKAKIEDRATWVKRKARLVVCGNYAASESMSLYTEAAPSEAVRTALVTARRNRWMVGIIDIAAAFLRTPIGARSDDPIIIATPPRLLRQLDLIESQELWGLIRALYGLRQSPVLWARHRDQQMMSMQPPGGLSMERGRTITSWWSVRNRNGQLTAVILIYVDDYLLLGPREVIEGLAAMVQKEWETSELSILSERNPIKFLGMELTLQEEEIYVNQQGYIEELMRSHGMSAGDHSRIPVGKDDAVYDLLPSDVEPSEDLIHKAQQATGELLWLSQRSRPDLSFACCILSSMSTRAPARVIAMATKMLKYVNYTKSYHLKISWTGNNLVLFPDAAFAPGSNRSQTGWVIVYAGTPVLWRSSRQATTALSSAEAELSAILEGSVAMLGVEAMLQDLGEYVDEKIVGSDSISALSLSAGTGSWRTRHLRIKAGWLQEAISSGMIKPIHVPGVRQPADLLTKALSGERIRALLGLWGISEVQQAPSTPRTRTASTAAARALVAMICCIMIVTVEAKDKEAATIQVDWDTAGILMILLMVLGALVLWELLKWGVVVLYQEWMPGASTRKLKRLRKLRDATALAIEKELERLTEESIEGGASPLYHAIPRYIDRAPAYKWGDQSSMF